MDKASINKSKFMGFQFNTLQFAKRAEKVGFTKKQAEFQAEEMAKIIGNDLASKEDILSLRHDLTVIRKEMAEMTLKLTIRLGGMLGVAIGILAVIIKL